MIVCSCRVVSDRLVRHAIAAGARTIDEVASLCGAGGRCQGCWPALQQLLDEASGEPGDLVSPFGGEANGNDRRRTP